MREIWRMPVAAVIAVVLAGCSTNYKPLRLDAAQSAYPTNAKVDPGGILAFDTSVDPASYPYILMTTASNYRPSNLSFTLRTALAQSGFVNVYTSEELGLLARDRGYPFPEDTVDAASLRRFSEEVGPVLLVDMRYGRVGDARMYGSLSVRDARTGRQLLKVDHPRTVWSDFDAEALYPVLNEFRRWVKSSTKKGVSA